MVPPSRETSEPNKSSPPANRIWQVGVRAKDLAWESARNPHGRALNQREIWPRDAPSAGRARHPRFESAVQNRAVEELQQVAEAVGARQARVTAAGWPDAARQKQKRQQERSFGREGI